MPGPKIILTRRRRDDLISLAALATCLSGPTYAQTVDAGSTGAGAVAPPATQTRPVIDPGYASVGDIVVTSRRREERAQDVPIALTVINEELLNRTGAYNIGQITQHAPSVQRPASQPQRPQHRDHDPRPRRQLRPRQRRPRTGRRYLY